MEIEFAQEVDDVEVKLLQPGTLVSIASCVYMVADWTPPMKKQESVMLICMVDGGIKYVDPKKRVDVLDGKLTCRKVRNSEMALYISDPEEEL